MKIEFRATQAEAMTPYAVPMTERDPRSPSWLTPRKKPPTMMLQQRIAKINLY